MSNKERTDRELINIWEKSKYDKGWLLVFETLSSEERNRIYTLLKEKANKLVEV